MDTQRILSLWPNRRRRCIHYQELFSMLLSHIRYKDNYLHFTGQWAHWDRTEKFLLIAECFTLMHLSLSHDCFRLLVSGSAKHKCYIFLVKWISNCASANSRTLITSDLPERRVVNLDIHVNIFLEKCEETLEIKFLTGSTFLEMWSYLIY